MMNKYIAPSFNKERGEQEFFDNLIWLRSEDAAKYLRTSVGQIRNMVYRGQLKARKFRNRLYFKRRELDNLLETSRM
ncbi:MAG: hypothetical protein COV91_03380 [Candidatus Taylorbacteria bacterium CG11_big_fil_rev_8_21_14_0_20_46_11]|uniref:Helix-turn-helix domain-containing protein n=1 Tax=Candidatus Taylorbacteria bacterium CG11_big_fil_rev_8_21_14_0_20_46_11 TaxID=1975025 RepID=A0A2H0KD93_9BACT|nr:MAG: hypothetical protein COV91_03380 [Candidatus Taylorbacteria bacterium CG11_big_fil_rev_8_21_14_0_20_46_11]